MSSRLSTLYEYLPVDCPHMRVSERNGYRYCHHPSTRGRGARPYCARYDYSRVLAFSCPLEAAGEGRP